MIVYLVVSKRISPEKIILIKNLRSRGWSLPEIHKKTGVSYGSVFRHIQNVQVLPKYKDSWYGKRGGSRKRKQKLEMAAHDRAQDLVSSMSEKEKAIFLAALYWGEGGKTDFNFTNSDPEMVRVFVNGLRDIFGISQDEIRASIRIYEDLDSRTVLNYWSKITGIPVNEFINVDILKGKKLGKLKYGLCRIRIKKGGNMLKYLLAINRRVAELC